MRFPAAILGAMLLHASCSAQPASQGQTGSGNRKPAPVMWVAGRELARARRARARGAARRAPRLVRARSGRHRRGPRLREWILRSPHGAAGITGGSGLLRRHPAADARADARARARERVPPNRPAARGGRRPRPAGRKRRLRPSGRRLPRNPGAGGGPRRSAPVALDDGPYRLVEYRLEGASARHIRRDHRMSVDQVLAEWIPAGFELVERIESMPSQHVFIFRAADPTP